MTQPIAVTAGTLRVPDAELYYEVRGHGPLVVLVGAPMDARSFAPLADLLGTDHTVLTTDPRGVYRSPMDNPNRDSTPEQRAGDLARLIEHVDAGPAVALGSSGGSVSALALAQAHPERVRTGIANEPPLLRLVDDRDALCAGSEEIIAAHLAGDTVGAWRKFLAQAGMFMPEPVFQQFFGGERDPQRAADEHHWFTHELRPTTQWEPDLAALRGGAPQVIVGIGEASSGQVCDRTSTALAAGLGVPPTMFPGGHTGFVDGPEAFAARLRAVTL